MRDDTPVTQRLIVAREGGFFSPTLKLCLQTLLVIVLLVVSVGGWSKFYYGNLADGVAYLRGDVISVSPLIGDLGEVRIGSEATYEIKIRNLSGSKVTILGIRADCACVVTNDLPVSLDSRQYHSLLVSLSIPQGSRLGPFDHQFLLYLDVDTRNTVFTVHGKAVE